MAVTIRVAPAAHSVLSEIARAQHVSLTEALSRAIAAYRREVFLTGVASDFDALHRETAVWEDEEAERAAWGATDGDGLAGEPAHPDARAATGRRAPAKSARRKARRR